MLQCVPDQLRDVTVRQSVIDVLAGSPAGYEVFRPQDPQPLRDSGNLLAGGLGDFADAGLAGGEIGEQAKARGIAHGTEQARGAVDCLR